MSLWFRLSPANIANKDLQSKNSICPSQAPLVQFFLALIEAKEQYLVHFHCEGHSSRECLDHSVEPKRRFAPLYHIYCRSRWCEQVLDLIIDILLVSRWSRLIFLGPSRWLIVELSMSIEASISIRSGAAGERGHCPTIGIGYSATEGHDKILVALLCMSGYTLDTY